MVYEISRIIFRLIFTRYFRGEYCGKQNIVAAESGIIAVNHSSFLDPAIVGIPIRKKIYYVAKRDLFKNPIARWYFTRVNGIPLDRDKPDLPTLKKLLKLIKDGNLVVMFPEGTRSVDGSLGEGRLGVGLLAAKTRATIYPCYIMGAGKAWPKGAKIFRPRKVRVIFGRPVRYDDLYDKAPARQAYEEISRSIMGEIEKLKQEMEEKPGVSKKCNRGIYFN